MMHCGEHRLSFDEELDFERAYKKLEELGELCKNGFVRL